MISENSIIDKKKIVEPGRKAKTYAGPLIEIARNFPAGKLMEIHGNTMEPIRNSQETHGFPLNAVNFVEFFSINIKNWFSMCFPWLFHGKL